MGPSVVVPEEGMLCLAGLRLPFGRFGRHVSPECCDDVTGERAHSKAKLEDTVFLKGH